MTIANNYSNGITYCWPQNKDRKRASDSNTVLHSFGLGRFSGRETILPENGNLCFDGERGTSMSESENLFFRRLNGSIFPENKEMREI